MHPPLPHNTYYHLLHRPFIGSIVRSPPHTPTCSNTFLLTKSCAFPLHPCLPSPFTLWLAQQCALPLPTTHSHSIHYPAAPDADDEASLSAGTLTKDTIVARFTDMFGEVGVTQLGSDDWKVSTGMDWLRMCNDSGILGSRSWAEVTGRWDREGVLQRHF